MNKNEYFQRVFEGQTLSLEREANQYAIEIKELTNALEQAKLNLIETEDLLSHARKELRKYT